MCYIKLVIDGLLRRHSTSTFIVYFRYCLLDVPTNTQHSSLLHTHRYVLYKEKNMLLTETNLARRHGYDMLQPDRRRKVQKSMGAIKHVLGERKNKKINEHNEYLAQVEKFEGLMADMKLDSDTIEDSMNSEAEKLNS